MDIKLPKVGESITEAIINKWMKSVGDSVKTYESLAEIVTDKVTMEFPSPVSGIITEICFPEGSSISVDTTILKIKTDKDKITDNTWQADTNFEDLRHIGTFSEETTPVGPTGSGNTIQNNTPPQNTNRSTQKYSPVVTKLAKQHSLDLSTIKGSGQNGRITKNDIEEIIAKTGQIDSYQPKHKLVKLTPIRRTIAENMLKSAKEIPEAWTLVEVDLSQLVNLKSKSTNNNLYKDTKFTYMPFIVKSIVKSIKKNPIINSQWSDEGILIKQDINIGFAVATEIGLQVPVIKSADQFNILELQKRIAEFTAKARGNELNLDDVSNGTFTINNTGALGSIIGKAIIYPGQAAIINTESIQKRPIIINDKINIRSMMNVCLTFDHRIMDGSEASKFMNDVKIELQSIHKDFRN